MWMNLSKSAKSGTKSFHSNVNQSWVILETFDGFYCQKNHLLGLGAITFSIGAIYPKDKAMEDFWLISRNLSDLHS